TVVAGPIASVVCFPARRRRAWRRRGGYGDHHHAPCSLRTNPSWTAGFAPDHLIDSMATDLRLPTDRIVRPDKDRFLHEENPFEAIVSRFDRAADLLDLEPGLYKVLRHPEKQITISIPVLLDNGEVEVYTGHRVLYNTSRGPAKGGIRFDMNVT